MSHVPQLFFVSNLETETNRIIHASVQTANGFYHSKKFAVLPYLVKNDSSTVYLPELSFEQIPNYWNNLAKISDYIPLDYDNLLVQQVAALNLPIQDLSETISNLHTQWNQKQTEIYNFLENMFPTEFKKIEQIEIRVTSFGTNMSYEYVFQDKIVPFVCYLRQDMNISHVVEALVQGILHAHQSTKNYSWEVREAISDFILEQASNQNIVDAHTPTLNSLNKVDPELLAKSDMYLKNIGLNFEKPFKKDNQLIILNGKIISAKLTSLQHLVLSALIDKQNQIVSYDELADILWTDDDEFSIWAINKTMQRLRIKLDSLGAPKRTLTVVKGNGYSLLN
jgi:hypothetical protein